MQHLQSCHIIHRINAHFTKPDSLALCFSRLVVMPYKSIFTLHIASPSFTLVDKGRLLDKTFDSLFYSWLYMDQFSGTQALT